MLAEKKVDEALEVVRVAQRTGSSRENLDKVSVFELFFECFWKCSSLVRMYPYSADLFKEPGLLDFSTH